MVSVNCVIDVAVEFMYVIGEEGMSTVAEILRQLVKEELEHIGGAIGEDAREAAVVVLVGRQDLAGFNKMKLVELRFRKPIRELLGGMEKSDELANRLGVNESTIYRWRKRLGLPTRIYPRGYKAGTETRKKELP